MHRGTDHGGRCHIFARGFTSLCHHAPVEAKEPFITVSRGRRVRDTQSQESKWLHTLSNPVICNHKQLHPLSDVRLHSEIRHFSLPSVPQSRTSLIRRESLLLPNDNFVPLLYHLSNSPHRLEVQVSCCWHFHSKLICSAIMQAQFLISSCRNGSLIIPYLKVRSWGLSPQVGMH